MLETVAIVNIQQKSKILVSFVNLTKNQMIK
jgi:hypothetical protein